MRSLDNLIGNCSLYLENDYDTCPGKYCARMLLNSTSCTFSQCQKCPRGYRASKDLDLCIECTNQPKLYDYMYLAFMFNMSLVLHFIFIDNSFSNIKKKKNNLTWHRIALIYTLPLFECILSMCLSILVFSPFGRFELNSCQIESFFDWYSIFFNPYTDYFNKLNCSQEVVYPFYSLLMVFFMLSVFIMLLTRCVAKKFLFDNRIYIDNLNTSTFAALYFIPVLFLVHTIAGGILYYTYPIITGVVFLLSNNYHLSNAFKKDFNTGFSAVTNIINAFRLLKETRNIFIQLIHFYFYVFAIVAFTEMKNYFDLFYLLLVPIPLCFFLLSYKHSSPKRLTNY